MPCLRELREDFSRVSAVLGPFDLAPLARAVSDFSCEGNRFSFDLRVVPRLGEFGWIGLEIVEWTAIINLKSV